MQNANYPGRLPLPMPPRNAEIVALAEHFLAEARAGRVLGVALTFVRPDGNTQDGVCGAGLAGLNLGLDNLKAQILRASVAPVQGSPIIRARPLNG